VSDDSITVSQPLTRPLQIWGSLEILEEIGHGGFGVVYRAWEPALAREVALKIIRPSEPTPETLAAILREGQLLARVRHPNVVTVYGAQQIGDEVGLWMEFVRGRSLADLVKHDGPRAANEAAVLGISLCQAIAAVHQAGVLHRDIKAHNVMRESGGRIVLMDFGAGQLLEAPRHADERAIGTPAYMAPEVLAGGRSTVRSDIYSLGILLYYLVSGTYPVDGNSWTDFLLAHARFERRPLGDVRPDIDPKFVRVVEKATALNPEERYATPGSMLADLNLAATGRRGTQGRRGSKTDSRKRKAIVEKKRRNHWPMVAAIAGPMLVPLGLGALASAAFNQTVGRTSQFAHEGVLDWWKWGIKALVPGAVEVIVVLLLWFVLAAVWKVARRLSGGAERISLAVRDWVRGAAERTGLQDPETATQAVVAVQAIALVVFWWAFRDMFSAFISFIDRASPADIEPLRPDHLDRHQIYNLVIALFILGMTVGAGQIVKMRRRAGVKPSASLVLVFAGIGLALMILAFPYRLMWHNQFEMATYQGARCYILGTAPSNALLYCPDDSMPRVKAVGLPDDALVPSGRLENIYTR
jgi:serine/threonine-protein kinase